MLKSNTGALTVYSAEVLSEHIDYNGHMNVACYVLLFDEATDAYKTHVGLDTDYRLRTNCSTFAAELHITYLQELKPGERIQVETQLLDCDDKRHHFIHTMYRHSDDSSSTSESTSTPCATMEVMSMHIDLSVRRPAPFPQDIQTHIAKLMDEHRHLSRPAQAGHIIGIRRK